MAIAGDSTFRPGNHLSAQKSPYLLQHQHNPVDWWPWGAEAFERARDENKPIFLSIGYATCHWCHVMAHESFENAAVAAVLNAHFVAIKLDREERPDIDGIYMTAVQAITGHGGWPLSAWLTPQGQPFFGGTYFPRPQFLQILEKIAETWRTRAGDVLRDAEEFTRFLHNAVTLPPADGQWTSQVLHQAIVGALDAHRESFDAEYGGFGMAPKFPQTMNLMLLLRQGERTMVEATLNAMATHGMYDQLMGGFHRYSTDRHWQVPHFEKMLYDQAWLAMTYIEGLQVFNNPLYERVARETLDYVLREMTSPLGGFYSAQDADSLDPFSREMHEGFFATYTWQDLEQTFSAYELTELQKLFTIHPDGHWEGRNILQRRDRGAPGDQDNLLRKLRALRHSKPQPLTDDKVLTAWNGWMIMAFVRAAQALQEPRYLNAAVRATEFILTKLWDGKHLYRRYRDGEVKEVALSDDAAALIAALLDLYEATGEMRWLDRAQQLQKWQDQRFWDAINGGYFREDSSDPFVLLKLKEDHDGVRPCSNSLSCMNLLRLGHLLLDPSYRERAEKILQIWSEKLRTSPMSLPYMLVAADFYLSNVLQVAALGDLVQPLREGLARVFAPHKVLATSLVVPADSIQLLKGKSGGIYICELGECHLPVQEIAGAVGRIAGKAIRTT